MGELHSELLRFLVRLEHFSTPGKLQSEYHIFLLFRPAVGADSSKMNIAFSNLQKVII